MKLYITIWINRCFVGFKVIFDLEKPMFHHLKCSSNCMRRGCTCQASIGQSKSNSNYNDCSLKIEYTAEAVE